MSLFTPRSTAVRYGVIIEIGSGSVLVAIVRSTAGSNHPDIIWSVREQTVRREISDLSSGAKNVLTALMNVVLLVESEGKAALKAAAPGATLTHIQVSITAPWSYTITKVISYSTEGTFTVTAALIASLMDAAQKKITEDLKENELASDLGLTIMTRATTDILANGYKTSDPVGEKAETITLTQVSAVAQSYLTDAIADVHTKVLPRASIERFSFMLMFHCIIRDLHHSMTEYCLIDVTDEATEIGIVRGGILHYCTHTAFGISTLAREIAICLNIPIDEAVAFLREPYHSHQLSELTDAKRAEVEIVFSHYQAAVTALFHETGDTLSIPKVLFIHGGADTESFFSTQISLAAKAATSTTHTAHAVSTELLTAGYTPEQLAEVTKQGLDTAVLVAAAFFHKQHHCNDFIQV